MSKPRIKSVASVATKCCIRTRVQRRYFKKNGLLFWGKMAYFSINKVFESNDRNLYCWHICCLKYINERHYDLWNTLVQE